jgi:hypothetical protein
MYLSALICYIMSNVIYISVQRYKLWLIIDDAYGPVRLIILLIRLMHMFIALLYYCDNLFHYGLLFFFLQKKKFLNMFYQAGRHKNWY